MYFYITLHKISTEKVRDNRWDPFNRRVELFQTWHLCELDPLKEADAEGQESNWMRQGFSLRGAPKSGSSFGDNDSRIVVDPQITFGFPDDIVDEGSQSRFRFDVHYWEAEKTGADKVRALFSDSTLNYMTEAWKAAGEDEAEAKKAVGGWLKENWQDIMLSLVGAASPAALGVMSGMNLLPLAELLFQLARNQGAKYHQMHRYIFDLEGTGESVKWRVTAPSNTHEATVGEGLLKVAEPVSDAKGWNAYETEFRFRVLR